MHQRQQYLVAFGATFRLTSKLQRPSKDTWQGETPHLSLGCPMAFSGCNLVSSPAGRGNRPEVCAWRTRLRKVSTAITVVVLQQVFRHLLAQDAHPWRAGR